jgi:UDP-N-acetylglucosamine transferase subunit ALG13
MIFVTVGSAPHSFKRLIQKMDEIALRCDDEVIIQKGLSSYEPINTKYFDFVEYEVAMNYFRNADLIVSHASAGPILYARKFNKPLIMVPRQGSLHEHVDNHQMETAHALGGSSEMIEVIYDINDLYDAIKRAYQKISRNTSYGPPASINGLIEYINSFINTIEKSEK